MFTKQVFSALTIAGVLLLISAAIAGLKFGVLICTDRSNTVPSAVIMIRDTYDIFLLIIKPLFVLVFVCQFSPYINSVVSQWLPLCFLEFLYGCSAGDKSGSVLCASTVSYANSDSIPSLEPNPNDTKQLPCLDTDKDSGVEDFVFHEIYGRVPKSVYDKWQNDDAKTRGYATSACVAKSCVNKKNSVPVRSFGKTRR